MMSLILSTLFTMQQVGQVAEAVYSDDQQTWTLEYPVVISHHVEGYYNCLKSQELFVGDGRNFELQHRDSIQACEKVEKTSFDQANALLEKRGSAGTTTPEDIAQIFETIRLIHIQRGRDLDNAINVQLAAGREARNSMSSEGIGGVASTSTLSPEEVAACAHRLRDLRAARQAYAEAEGPKAAAIHAQDRYSDEDRRALLRYQAGLARYSSNIAYEMRRCPAETPQ